MQIERPEVLPCKCHKIRIVTTDISFSLYVTISLLDDKPYELFLNTKNSWMTEHTIAVSILISKMLRNDIPIKGIAEELTGIASPVTGHMKQGGFCKSMYARIGEILLEYQDKS